MGSVFKNCTSLVYVNLSNLVTNKVRHMDFMFYNCISLTSLNLSHFDTSQVTWIESMFDGCINLEYINLKNVAEKQELNYTNIFRGIPENIVICLIEENTPILTSLIRNLTCPIIYCDDDWKQNQIKMINNTEKCSQSCNELIMMINAIMNVFVNLVKKIIIQKIKKKNFKIYILIAIKILKDII